MHTPNWDTGKNAPDTGMLKDTSESPYHKCAQTGVFKKQEVVLTASVCNKLSRRKRAAFIIFSAELFTFARLVFSALARAVIVRVTKSISAASIWCSETAAASSSWKVDLVSFAVRATDETACPDPECSPEKSALRQDTQIRQSWVAQYRSKGCGGCLGHSFTPTRGLCTRGLGSWL